MLINCSCPEKTTEKKKREKGGKTRKERFFVEQL